MRAIVVGACLLALNAPLAAHAGSCEADAQNRRVAGTVIGAVGGAVIGNQVSHSGGTIVGGLLGGFAGNQLSKTHCPPHTHYTSTAHRERRAAPLPAPRQEASQQAQEGPGSCAMEDRPFYDAHGNLIQKQIQVCR
jgi:phage tail tape-measure protein